MSDYLDPNNEELLKDFFVEAQMQVEVLEQNILVLENDPSSQDAIDEIFRAAHTLKGSAGAVQMIELSDFTHLLEDVLDEIRNGNLDIDSDLIDYLLESIDIIKAMLDSKKSGETFNEDISDLKGKLESLLSGTKKEKSATTRTVEKRKEPSPVKAKTKAHEGREVSEYELLELKHAAGDERRIFKVTVHFDENNPMNTVGGIQVFAVLKEMGKILKTSPEFERLYEDNFFPVVEYYVATEEDEENIIQKLIIPDVTTDVNIQDLTEKKELLEKPPTKKTEEKETEITEKKAPAIKEEQEPREEPARKPAEIKKTGVVSSILRVDSSRIDNLLNLVSEAVINKATFNQISSQFTESLEDFQNTEVLFQEKQRELFENLPEYLKEINNGKSVKEIKKEVIEKFGDLFNLFDSFENKLKTTINNFRSTAGNLGRITSELHEKVLQIRMVPISQIFSRFPRLVRDLSKSLNKNIELKIEGEDTELDKSVIEDLLDPLIHCVRNSIDHGLESPEERSEAGKPPTGHILLKASNEGNLIIIEIVDDGRGIDVDAVRQRAIDRGLIHPNKTLSDLEAFNLIFEPGFSTAKKVTNISGRGVGLDVVKKQIDKLNGSASIWSEKGKGTKITIKLPLTLAIIQGLLVKVGKETYAIPITSVLESHRIKPSEIKMIDNYEVFNVREDVVSLIRLNRLFRIVSDEKKDYFFVVIVGSGDKKMGLVVDSLIGEEDVVIKPLRDRYTNAPGIAGATILGDGTVSLIIDVSQLLELGLKREIEDRRKLEATIR